MLFQPSPIAHAAWCVVAAALCAAACASAHAQPADAPQTTTLAPVRVTGQIPVLPESLPLDASAPSASRLGTTLRQTPASVTLIDGEVLAQRGTQTTQQALEGVPGMTAAAPPGLAGAVFYRGFSGGSVTQMFNGIGTQYDVIAARPQDSWIYEQVEAVGGPSGYLNGAGAVGGSVNYVTKSAQREGDFAEGLLRYGSFGHTEVAAGFNRRIGGVASPGQAQHVWRFDASYNRGGTGFDHENRRAFSLATSLRSAINLQWSHLLSFEYQNEKVDRPYWGTPLLNPATGQGRIDPATRSTNYNVADGFYGQTVKWWRSELQWTPSPDTAVKNTLYYYDALRDWRNLETYAFNPANSGVVRSMTLLQRHDQRIVGDRLELTHKGTLAGLPTRWALGAEWSYNRQTRFPLSLRGTVDTVNPYQFAPGSFWSLPGVKPGFDPDRTNSVRNAALFAENRLQLGDQWALVSGLRMDRIALDGTNHREASPGNPVYFRNVYRPVTGRLGLTWDMTPNASAYVQYSTAADPPAGLMATAAYSQVRDFGLTSGRQFEAGGKFSFAEGKGNGTVAAYHITRSNLSMADPNNPLNTLPIGRQSSRGVEAALSYQFSPAWSAQGNVSWVDARYDDFVENVGGKPVSRAGNRPVNIPAAVANLWLGWKPAPDWQLGVEARYVSRRYADTANTLWGKGYVLWGASVDWRINPHARLSLRGRNLGNRVYAAYASPGAFYLGAPRSVDLTLHATY